jgi:cyclopropane fatty-acyl-phospholipid synthase-like methyltransferase
MATTDLTSEETKRFLKEGYNKSADRYLQWVRHGHPKGWDHRLAILDRLYGFLGIADGNHAAASGKIVLDLGCGAGEPVTLSLAAHPGVSKVYANDQSIAQLDLFSQSVKVAGNESKVELLESDMMSAEVPEGSLDAVVAFYSIIHLPREEQIQIVKRCHSFVKPGGFFLANFASQPSEGNVNEDWLGMKSYWSGWGAEESMKIVKDAGFEVVFQEVLDEFGDASFQWVIARKR